MDKPFASRVVVLSDEDVEYMFGNFWKQEVVPPIKTDKLFKLTAGFSDGGFTIDSLHRRVPSRCRQIPLHNRPEHVVEQLRSDPRTRSTRRGEGRSPAESGQRASLGMRCVAAAAEVVRLVPVGSFNVGISFSGPRR